MDIPNSDVASSPAATGGPRKSGRAVKAPQKFAPDVQLSQTSAKRKRGVELVQNDASDTDEEDDELDEESGSAEEDEVNEPRRNARISRKPAAKKVRVNGMASHEDAPAVSLPARPKKGAKKIAMADRDTEGLYAEVFTSGEPVSEVAQQWLTRYADDSVGAIVDFVNFLLKSAGCDLKVNENDIEDSENVDGRLADLQNEHQAQNITDYPLISKLKSSHAFRSSFIGFFDQLVEVMHASQVMYEDSSLMEHIHLWTATMSSSTSRPFRHTATLAALTLTTAMARAAHKEIDVAAKILRQQLAEQNKKKGANKGRLADFKNRVAANERNKPFIENQMRDFFDTVYVHRYRDVDPRIRLECVEALGTWIIALPSYFFEGQFLRYMGWVLSDTHGPMRHEVIRELAKIMKNEANHAPMRHFIERFRPRLVEMATRDSEPAVRAAAVGLVDQVRQAGFLEPDDIDVVGKLVFDTEPKVRKSLVGFFSESIKDIYEAKVEELGGEEILEDILTVDDAEDFDTPRGGWIRFKCLAEILLNYDAEDQIDMPNQIDTVFLSTPNSESRFTLAAQALYEKLPDLQDWEVLAGYLLFDHTSATTGTDTERALKEAFRPSEQEEAILLEILYSIVKLNVAHDDEIDKGKDRSKKGKSRAEINEDTENFARRLASVIPKLLKKYGADPTTAAAVLRLEHVLNLNVFQELRQDSTVYAKLLDEISAQFIGHSDQIVLSEAGAALLHGRGFEELAEIAEDKVQSLWEETISMLRKFGKSAEISVRGAMRKKPLTELSNALRRLETLASISSCVEHLEAEVGKGGALPGEIILNIIARGVFEDLNDDELDALEDEVTLSAMRIGLFFFMWKVRALTESIASGEGISDRDVDSVREWQGLFTTNVTAAFSSRLNLDPVRVLGAGTLLDTHTLFARLRPSAKGKPASRIEENATLQSLVIDIGPEVQKELTVVFDGLEKQFAKKSKKRLAEPGEYEDPEDIGEDPEDEDDEESNEDERQNDALRAEHQLCEFTGKLVLGIVAKVIDNAGPLKGKLRIRMQRNRSRLGPNFKELIGHMDDPKPKGLKGQRGKTYQAADASKRKTNAAAKSAELVEEEEEEDPFADVEPEEGTVEDLRRRELQEEETVRSEDGDGPVDEEEDDVMGD